MAYLTGVVVTALIAGYRTVVLVATAVMRVCPARHLGSVCSLVCALCALTEPLLRACASVHADGVCRITGVLDPTPPVTAHPSLLCTLYFPVVLSVFHCCTLCISLLRTLYFPVAHSVFHCSITRVSVVHCKLLAFL